MFSDRHIGIFLLGVLAWVKSKDPGVFLVTLLVWLITLATQYENTRYRIFRKDGVIRQASVSKFVTTINCAEITRIAQARSDLAAVKKSLSTFRRGASLPP